MSTNSAQQCKLLHCLYSGAKKTYSDEFTIDLKAGVSMPYGKVATEGKELRTISYALQEMLQKNL